MTLSHRAVEAAARAISDADGSGWDTILGRRECERSRYRALAESALTAALAVDGLCLVPKCDLFDVIEVAHRNEYHPSIIRLRAMFAAASDGEYSPPAGTEG